MKIKLICYLFIITALITGGCHPSKMTFSNGKKWIPEDFNPETTILLVEKFSVSKKKEQQMRDYMTEKYPYKYEFASAEDIKNRSGKYADAKVYRYALVITSHSDTYQYADGSRSKLRTTGYDLHFFDRELNRHYPETKKSSSNLVITFKPVINTILQEHNTR